jgi:hypothetical protein
MASYHYPDKISEVVFCRGYPDVATCVDGVGVGPIDMSRTFKLVAERDEHYASILSKKAMTISAIFSSVPDKVVVFEGTAGGYNPAAARRIHSSSYNRATPFPDIAKDEDEIVLEN